MDNVERSYKRWTIYQLIDELERKLKRLKEDTSEWACTKLRIENLKRDLDE